MSGYRPIEERFWEKVDKKSTSECWPWLGAANKIGGAWRGRLRRPRERSTDFAYRISYELHYGDIPEGTIVCHKCDNPICVNPHHLYAGTYTENNLDRFNHGRQAGGARKGESHHMAKLSLENVKSIRELLNDGVSQIVIAREFNIGQSQVSRIKHGESWGHET